MIFNSCFNLKYSKHVSTIHNNNLFKIASSVNYLFENSDVSLVNNVIEDDELLDLKVVNNNVEDVKETVVDSSDKDDENTSNYLYSIDASKYSSNSAMGFEVTENNKTYSLSDYEFNVVTAVVAGEYDINLNDALAVVSVILNRCDSSKWNTWAGKTPYTQVIASGQFEVYFEGYYLAYMPGGSQYGSTKYNVAKQAVIDGLNGIRNNNYLSFRANYVTSYSNIYIVVGGNRYK